MRKYLLAALLGMLTLCPPVSARAAEWRIDDDHSNAYFSIQHLTVAKVRGTFSTVTGALHTDDLTGKVTGLNFTVAVKSIDTGVDKRDEHLRSPDFFDAARYPEMTFVSKTVADQGDTTLLVTGDLTIHGVTREVKVTLYGPSPEIKDPWGLARRGLRLESQLNRQDFGIKYNQVLDNGGLMIGDLVDTEADIEVVGVPVNKTD